MPIDVLLLQLGTPEAPTTAALRPYLRQFLSDPRVIEAPAAVRWALVNLYIVPFRSPQSAVKYQRIWDSQSGSPLRSITVKQRALLATALGDNFRVHYAMRYGQPSVDSVVEQLAKLNCSRLVALPMFPQYSATTTGSAFDALFDALKQQRVIPSLRLIAEYYTNPGYLDAVVGRLRHYLAAAHAQGDDPEIFLISFHGIPMNYIKRGDPYLRQAAITSRLIAKRMGWAKEQWKLVFQSRLGRQKWLTPYTDETLKQLGQRGVKTVLITQPGFTADCLETIDEIGNEGKEDFRHAAGETLVRVPCLNEDPLFIEAMKNLVLKEAEGW